MDCELVGHWKKLRIFQIQVRDVNFGLAQLYSDRRGFSTSYAPSARMTYVGGLTVRPTVRCTYLNHRRQTETTPAATDWRAFCFSPTSVTYKNPRAQYLKTVRRRLVSRFLTVDLGTFPRWVMFLLAFSLAIRILCLGAMSTVKPGDLVAAEMNTWQRMRARYT